MQDTQLFRRADASEVLVPRGQSPKRLGEQEETELQKVT